MSKVHVVEVGASLDEAVRRTFDPFGGLRAVLAGRDEVLVKVNAVDFKTHCYTPPDLVEALVLHLFREGAKRVFVMDNCTQGNFTRLVFHVTGMTKAVRRAGGKVLYLDEGPEETLSLKGRGGEGQGGHPYDQTDVALPRAIVDKLIRNRASVAYINVPKFKTHCMTRVTLGIKNQWGFVAQKDRINDHNDQLHRKLVDILELIRPDFTLIDAREATQHGHYPSKRLADRQVVPYGLLVGGDDIVSVDAAGCFLMGMPWQEVEHVRLAHERGYGMADLERVEVVGDIRKHVRTLSWELLPVFPGDVDVHRGAERCCVEGCASNVMACLQVFSLDFDGKGGFSIVMGKGWDKGRLEGLQDRIMVVGKCAAEEVGDMLKGMYGADRVAVSFGCNNLTDTITILLKWMKVSPLRMVPVSPLRSLMLLGLARLRGSSARIPPLWIR